MNKVLAGMVIGGLGLFAYQRMQKHVLAPDVTVEREEPQPFAATEPEAATSTGPKSAFHCDGRTYCSQMTSCEEATWFL